MKSERSIKPTAITNCAGQITHSPENGFGTRRPFSQIATEHAGSHKMTRNIAIKEARKR